MSGEQQGLGGVEVTITCEAHTDGTKYGYWVADRSNACKCEWCDDFSKWVFIPVSKNDARYQQLPERWRNG